jgi:hypothetical protein
VNTSKYLKVADFDIDGSWMPYETGRSYGGEDVDVVLVFWL